MSSSPSEKILELVSDERKKNETELTLINDQIKLYAKDSQKLSETISNKKIKLEKNVQDTLKILEDLGDFKLGNVGIRFIEDDGIYKYMAHIKWLNPSPEVKKILEDIAECGDNHLEGKIYISGLSPHKDKLVFEGVNSEEYGLTSTPLYNLLQDDINALEDAYENL